MRNERYKEKKIPSYQRDTWKLLHRESFCGHPKPYFQHIEGSKVLAQSYIALQIVLLAHPTQQNFLRWWSRSTVENGGERRGRRRNTWIKLRKPYENYFTSFGLSGIRRLDEVRRNSPMLGSSVKTFTDPPIANTSWVELPYIVYPAAMSWRPGLKISSLVPPQKKHFSLRSRVLIDQIITIVYSLREKKNTGIDAFFFFVFFVFSHGSKQKFKMCLLTWLALHRDLLFGKSQR